MRVGGTASQEPEASFDLADLARSIMEPQRLGFSAVTLLQSMAFGALLAAFRVCGRDLIGVSPRQEVPYLARSSPGDDRSRQPAECQLC